MTDPGRSAETRSLTRRFLLLVGFLTAAIVLSSQPADAHDSHGWVWIGTDRIYNWDHKERDAVPDWAERDWPVGVVFWNNASRGKIEIGQPGNIHTLDDFVFRYDCNVFDWCDMNLRYDDSGREDPANGPFAWFSDGGRKESRCGLSGGQDVWSLHYRSYGDTFWNPQWGFFVPMTTHFDWDDPGIPFTGCDDTKHGFDETAEGWILFWYGDAANGPGWSYIEDWMHLHNPSGFRIQNGRSHFGNGDGLLSIIHVP